MNSHPPMPPPPPVTGNLPPQQPPAFVDGQPSGFAPSVHTKGASRAKDIVLTLLVVFVTLPILAMIALTMLGRTVEESGAGVAEISEFAASDAPPVLAFDDPWVPSGAQLHVDADGVFSMWTDPSWPEPSIHSNEFNNSNVTFWWIDEYSTPTFQANVNVTYAPQPAGATLDAVAEAELELSRTVMSVNNVEQRDELINGTTVRVLSYEGTIEGADLRLVSAFRLDGDFARMATLGIPIEFAADGKAAVVPYLLTVSGAETTG